MVVVVQEAEEAKEAGVLCAPQYYLDKTRGGGGGWRPGIGGDPFSLQLTKTAKTGANLQSHV